MKDKNLAPQLIRSWTQIELKPKDKKIITSENVEKFQKKLTEICGMHIFCGPMVIAPDSENALSPYYTNKEFQPRDWNAYTWWTQPEAKNVVSILDKSHQVFYYYPEHNLINISISTCKDYDINKALDYIREFWKPNDKGIRYAYIDPSNKNIWKTA